MLIRNGWHEKSSFSYCPFLLLALYSHVLGFSSVLSVPYVGADLGEWGRIGFGVCAKTCLEYWIWKQNEVCKGELDVCVYVLSVFKY